VLVEPVNSLQESLLLGILLVLVAQVASDSKAVLDSAEKVDLVNLFSSYQNLLALVSLFHWEDAIGFSSRDTERSGDVCEFVFVDKGWVGDVTDVDTFTGSHKAADIFGTETISDGSNLGVSGILKVLDGSGDYWVNFLEGVRIVSFSPLGEPGHEVKVSSSVQRDWVAIEKIGQYGVIAISGELICYELSILPDTNYVRKVEDGGVLVDDFSGGFSDIYFNAANLDGLSGGLAIVLNAD